jgi:protein TonB
MTPSVGSQPVALVPPVLEPVPPELLVPPVLEPVPPELLVPPLPPLPVDDDEPAEPPEVLSSSPSLSPPQATVPDTPTHKLNKTP